MSPLLFYFAVLNICDSIVFFPAVHDPIRIYTLLGHDHFIVCLAYNFMTFYLHSLIIVLDILFINLLIFIVE